MNPRGHRAKLALAVLAGAAALHLVLAACGQSSSTTAQCQNCPSGSSPQGAGLAPSGAVMAYAGGAAPDGWLICDGSAMSRTQYASLFAAIGTAHGSGDGASTFLLPDYRGRFLRGVDNGQQRDPDALTRTAASTGGNAGDAVGSLEVAALASHTHAVMDPGHSHGVSDPGHIHTGCLGVAQAAGAYTSGYPGTVLAGYNNCESTGQMIHGAATGIGIQGNATGVAIEASGGSETRPVNAAVTWIIKT